MWVTTPTTTTTVTMPTTNADTNNDATTTTPQDGPTSRSTLHCHNTYQHARTTTITTTMTSITRLHPALTPPHAQYPPRSISRALLFLSGNVLMCRALFAVLHVSDFDAPV
ncbi:hypothetical protein Hypma_008292 [Hypsizygus marmoreus]|uniref:Uncharacterized protein n=1 Tax=Hypsizygus marmoreus TaxID=39966 RepID=A0A369JXY5_HYPMA|nr:hypothetical protein Hypma_008292 [Hypsizygus marmoreus]